MFVSHNLSSKISIYDRIYNNYLIGLYIAMKLQILWDAICTLYTLENKTYDSI